MKNKILILLMVVLLVVPLVSALEFLPIKQYDEDTQTVTIVNTLGLGADIATIQLNTPLNMKVGAGYQKVAEFTINNFEDTYLDAFEKMDFYNKINMEKIERDFDYKYKTTELIDVNDYEEICVIDKINGTKTCSNEIIGTHQELKEVWEVLDTSILYKGEITIGIFTDVKIKDYVEWIPTLFGKEIDEWASWTADLNTNLEWYFNCTSDTDAVNGILKIADREGTMVYNNTNALLNDACQYTIGNNGNLTRDLDMNFSRIGVTFNIWYRTENEASSPYIFHGRPVGNTQLIFNPDFYTIDFVSGAAFNPAGHNDQQWYMATFLHNTSGCFIFLNATMVHGGTCDTTQSLAYYSLGGLFNGASDLIGQTDEMSWHNRALTPTEITQLFNGGIGITYTTTFDISVILNNPLNETDTINSTINFNSTTSTNFGNITNTTLYVWYSNSTLFGSNLTTLSGNVSNTTTLSLSSFPTQESFIWNNYACIDNSTGSVLCGWAATNNTFETIVFELNAQSNESNVYETGSTTFTIEVNFTDHGTKSANLYWNDINQGAVTATTTGSVVNFSKTIQIPTNLGYKEFFWVMNSGAYQQNTTAYNQTVNLSELDLCNTTYIYPYINFTFTDEETLLDLNATIDTSTWIYYLGDGTYTKELLYSNLTLNDYYEFCFTGGNKTLHNTRDVQYSSPGYPQRRYTSSSDLTNSSENKTLYLLSSSDGIYTSIQVVDQNGEKLEGVQVIAERQFSGLWTIIGQETTDGSGLVTFWVNPDYDHRLTFSFDGCVGTVTSIRPTQTQYTRQLQCGAADEAYVSQIEGIKYARTPAEGLIQTGEHNFTFQVYSSKDNIENATLNIVNASSGLVLASVSSVCAPAGCTIGVLYTVITGDNLKGRYYINVGNGTFLIEGDAHWVNVLGPDSFDGKSGISTFFRDMKYVIDEWGDDSNTADFNRLVIVFFMLCIFISFLNFNFGIDTQNPGAFLVVLTFAILIGSIFGFFSYNNLFSDSDFLNSYLLAGICLLVTTSYFINVNRRSQQ